MLRADADVGEAELPQKPPDGVLAHRDAEAVLDNTNEIDATPSDDAVLVEIRPLPHQRLDLHPLLVCQLGWPPRRGVVDQRVDAAFVERVHPIAQRLAIHAADPRCRLPAHAVADSRQRQQPARLIGILGRCRSRPQLLGTHPLLERNRHHPRLPESIGSQADAITATPPPESPPTHSKRPSHPRVILSAGWYKAFGPTGAGRVSEVTSFGSNPGRLRLFTYA